MQLFHAKNRSESHLARNRLATLAVTAALGWSTTIYPCWRRPRRRRPSSRRPRRANCRRYRAIAGTASAAAQATDETYTPPSSNIRSARSRCFPQHRCWRWIFPARRSPTRSSMRRQMARRQCQAVKNSDFSGVDGKGWHGCGRRRRAFRRDPDAGRPTRPDRVTRRRLQSAAG